MDRYILMIKRPQYTRLTFVVGEGEGTGLRRLFLELV